MKPIAVAMLVCLVAAGCGPNMPLRGGGACDPLWDRLNYKKCYDDNQKEAEARERQAH